MIIKLKPYVKVINGYWIKQLNHTSYVYLTNRSYKIYLSRVSGRWIFYDYSRMRTIARETDLDKIKIIADDYIRKMLDKS